MVAVFRHGGHCCDDSEMGVIGHGSGRIFAIAISATFIGSDGFSRPSLPDQVRGVCVSRAGSRYT